MNTGSSSWQKPGGAVSALPGDAYQLAFRADHGIVASRTVSDFAVTVRAIFDQGENLAVLGRVLVN